jgi:hypothetical protein
MAKDVGPHADGIGEQGFLKVIKETVFLVRFEHP